MAFDPRGGCGVPGGGQGADVITELTQVAGDGAGGLWMVATAVPESGEDQLFHLSAGDVVRRISHRVPAVTSIAVSDDGSLLVVSDDRLLVLEDPEDELADLDDGGSCRLGQVVADPLQTRPQEAGDQVNIRGRSLPLLLDIEGTLLVRSEGEGLAIRSAGSVGGETPIDIGETEQIMSDGVGGFWALTADQIFHVRNDGEVEPGDRLGGAYRRLGRKAPGQVPPVISYPRDRPDLVTFDGVAPPVDVSAGAPPGQVVRTRSGDVVVLAEGQLFLLTDGGWYRIAGSPPRDGGPDDSSVAAFLLGHIPVNEVRLDRVDQIVSDPGGDGVLLVQDDLLFRVGIDGDIEAVAQDARLSGAQVDVVGGGLVVRDVFGYIEVLEEGP